MIQITDKPIEAQKVIDTVANLRSGAINVFIGTVRDSSSKKNVLWLEYEAYETMAIAEIQRIIDAALLQWPIMGWVVSHRVGILKPGEVAVVIAISSPHRKESFSACQFIIDEVKAKVPIWKKEVFEGGEEWISATP